MANWLRKVVLDLLALALAHESGVHEDRRELVADRPVDERRRDSGVDASREGTQHMTGADLGADRLDLRLRSPRRASRLAGTRRPRTGSA